jgi:hypothetical protein
MSPNPPRHRIAAMLGFCLNRKDTLWPLAVRLGVSPLANETVPNKKGGPMKRTTKAKTAVSRTFNAVAPKFQPVLDALAGDRRVIR